MPEYIDPKDLKPGMKVVPVPKKRHEFTVVWVDGETMGVADGGAYNFAAYNFEVVRPQIRAGQVWQTNGGVLYIVNNYETGKLAYRFIDGSGEDFEATEFSMKKSDLEVLLYDPNGEAR